MAFVWALAALASLSITWAARAYAVRRQLVDEPGERRSHAAPTPRGGGIGPVLVFLALVVLGGARGWLPGAAWPWLAGALALVAGIGWWDDHSPLGAGPRLAVHVVAGGMIASGFSLWQLSPVLALMVVFACVAAINIWNFMDGIDGIAATQTAIVAAGVPVLGVAGWSWLAVGMLACIAGFLPLNFPRARIFLGDVGSGALGLAVAIFAIAALGPDARPARLTLFLLPAAAFLVDASLTLLRRVARRERWWTPHTQHLYQGLARRFGHPRVTAAYAAWSCLGLLLIVVLKDRPEAVTWPCVVVWYTASAAAWAWAQHSIAGKTTA